jgi:hypothetical protein
MSEMHGAGPPTLRLLPESDVVQKYGPVTPKLETGDPAVAVGPAHRSLRSLSRRSLNCSTLGATGFPCNIGTTSKGVRHDRCICNVSLRRQFR